MPSKRSVKKMGETRPKPEANSSSETKSKARFFLLDISSLSQRWQSWLVRMQSGFILISSFYVIVQMGVLGLLLLTYFVQITSFHEALEVAIKFTKSEDLRMWSWQLLFLANFYWLDPVIASYVPQHIYKSRELICYMGYLCLLVWFLRSISDVSSCLVRYSHFAFTHVIIIFLTFQAYLLLCTLRHGMAWYIFSVSIITVNDIAAYMCGFFFGRTPLIALSPKKTLEGYIGGGIFTVAIGPMFGLLLSRFWWLSCPTSGFQVEKCQIQEFDVFNGKMPDFFWHSLAISLFASTFGPTAGFLCSGFKRACNKKNFGNLIPGHGGVLDRCDCMFLMASFGYIYTQHFL